MSTQNKFNNNISNNKENNSNNLELNIQTLLIKSKLLLKTNSNTKSYPFKSNNHHFKLLIPAKIPIHLAIKTVNLKSNSLKNQLTIIQKTNQIIFT
jgi:hypothetical protein